MKNFIKHISKILPENEINEFENSCFLNFRKSIRFFSYAKDHKKKIGYNDDFYSIEEKVEWTDDGFYLSSNSKPSKSLDYIRGDFYIQDASSMYPVAIIRKNISNILDINYILDYAASPGGKTTQLADYFPDSIIIANEVIKGRIDAIYSNLIRSKLKNIILLNKNFEFFFKLDLKFDIILADLPCSGESLIYKKKSSIKDWNYNEVIFNAKRQKKICSDLIKILNENSYFLYSTCTFSKEENEDIVEFLEKNNLFLVEQKRLWPHKDNCAGGYSAILNNKVNTFNNNKKDEFIENQNKILIKTLSKNTYFDIEKIINSGYLFLKDNIIFIFSKPRIIKAFFDNSVLIGQAIAKIEKHGIVPLWGSIDFAKDDRIIELDKNTLYKLSHGYDLNSLNIKLNSDYFVVKDEESSLFLLKKTENGIKNLIPNFMIVR